MICNTFWNEQQSWLLNGKSEAVIRIDNIMAKGQIHVPTKRYRENSIDQHELHFKACDELGCSGSIISSCSTSGIHRVILIQNPVISREREDGI